VVAPRRGEIRDEQLPDRSPHEVVVRALYSGISRGTESLVFNGAVPDSEHERMRAPFQAGTFPFPVKYGYCSVGQVEQGTGDLVGRTVFCLYPHQTRYIVPADTLNLVPVEIPAERAVLAANMETALNGVWDAAVQPGDRVVVVGAGTVGCLVAFIASRIAGCEVTLVDLKEHRRAVAAMMGVGFTTPDAGPVDCDRVFHASGSPEGLQCALGLAGFEATIVEMSWFGSRPVTLRLGESFHARRLTIRSSQVGHVAPSHRSRWDYRRRMRLALRLLADPVLDVLITGESRFVELPDVMADLAAGSRDALCHRIRYDGG
jgi:2-desacetyl-2-hydroxyethyl bacteriochlorophyllide A dehydrogenase